ncbi:LLM class flavin-dependent oxidoreductase [Tsuneonella sp. CC-YZS046]|uniref:LLM class flavin-dependent oxidoreductase n=1 Tax=Tsuneonella sp. CC-YZS046 TaxID=3042152 RepID=UPI002D782EF8|nr:LLM class flavin-dependent oxidoreductase [Tsuneonella sp. CC-YZS046]WRO66740.1 LLM class flavin-dependent oxidoreductase [Tsuneonella sp. CC-YZS046]
MEIGHLNVMQNWHKDLSDQQMFEGEIDLAIAADRLGFDSLWCVEHHFEDYGLCPDNIQYLSYLATRTRNAKLVPGAVILPWNDPLRVAEKMAVLEYFAPGRVALGIGRGLARREYRGFRVPMEEARGRFEEGARLVLDALDKGYMESDTELFQQPRVDIRPRPLRGYRDALYCVAMSNDSAEAAAELGGSMMTFIQFAFERHMPMIELYRERFRKVHGREAPPPVLTDVTVIHEDEEEARRLAYEHIGNHFIAVTDHYEFAGDHFKNIRGYESYQAGADLIKSAGLEESQKTYIEAQNYGTPKQVIEKYRERMELVGDFNAMLIVSSGGIPFPVAQNSLKLFAEQVMPELRRMSARSRVAA